jgi:NAD(P)-dependent dehydrogenase (short-subunit alcohol dehydrogenase family)
VALVTGRSRAIGAVIAARLAQAGRFLAGAAIAVGGGFAV